MQHIQDSEFDQLFKDKFTEAEVTPSVHLWDHIETQLAAKPRRVFPVYWLAAAIAVAAVSAGWLFSRTANDNRPDRVAVTRVAKPTVAIAQIPESVTANGRGKVTAVAAHVIPAQIVNAKLQTSAAIIKAEPDPIQADSKKELVVMQPLALNAHHDVKEIAVKQQIIPLPKSAATDAVILASTDMKAERGDEVINENESRGIRNMGDLINYVVDKVDKSDEKVIQFKTDDDNSSLIALNIGIIRFNSKKHK